MPEKAEGPPRWGRPSWLAQPLRSGDGDGQSTGSDGRTGSAGSPPSAGAAAGTRNWAPSEDAEDAPVRASDVDGVDDADEVDVASFTPFHGSLITDGISEAISLSAEKPKPVHLRNKEKRQEQL